MQITYNSEVRHIIFVCNMVPIMSPFSWQCFTLTLLLLLYTVHFILYVFIYHWQFVAFLWWVGPPLSSFPCEWVAWVLQHVVGKATAHYWTKAVRALLYRMVVLICARNSSTTSWCRAFCVPWDVSSGWRCLLWSARMIPLVLLRSASGPSWPKVSLMEEGLPRAEAVMWAVIPPHHCGGGGPWHRGTMWWVS